MKIEPSFNQNKQQLTILKLAKENTLITYDAIPCNINPISRARKQLEFGDVKTM